MNDLNTGDDSNTLNEDDYQRLRSMKNKGDLLVEYCLLTNMSMVDILPALAEEEKEQEDRNQQESLDLDILKDQIINNDDDDLSDCH